MTFEKVLIIGCGLIGGSLSLALSKSHVEHDVIDIAESNRNIVKEKGAVFTPMKSEEIQLVFIAVPPDQVVPTALEAFTKYPNAIISDVASIKSSIESEISKTSFSPRYVGGHPMAGKETSGAVSADPNLFEDRVWVVCRNSNNADAARSLEAFLNNIGAVSVLVESDDHDLTVAYLSHLPQILSSNLARISVQSANNLDVAGPGFRDMTRLSRSNPSLWTQILMANRKNIIEAVKSFESGLRGIRESLESSSEKEIYSFFASSVESSELLPGKHGGRPTQFATIRLRVPDKPGALAQVFSLAGSIDLNIEDVSIEHVLNRPIAILNLQISNDESNRAISEFRKAGWEIRD